MTRWLEAWKCGVHSPLAISLLFTALFSSLQSCVTQPPVTHTDKARKAAACQPHLISSELLTGLFLPSALTPEDRGGGQATSRCPAWSLGRQAGRREPASAGCGTAHVQRGITAGFDLQVPSLHPALERVSPRDRLVTAKSAGSFAGPHSCSPGDTRCADSYASLRRDSTVIDAPGVSGTSWVPRSEGVLGVQR